MERKIINKPITPLRIIFFLFSLIFFFLMFWLVFHSKNNIFKIIQNNDITTLIINYLIISVLLIVPLILLIKLFISFITKLELIIDKKNKNIILTSKFIFFDFIRSEKKIDLMKIKDFFLILISRNKIDLGIINTYNIYLIYNNNSYFKLHYYYSYKDAIKLLEFIKKGTQINYKDITNIKFDCEFDFIKYYEKRYAKKS